MNARILKKRSKFALVELQRRYPGEYRLGFNVTMADGNETLDVPNGWPRPKGWRGRMVCQLLYIEPLPGTPLIWLCSHEYPTECDAVSAWDVFQARTFWEAASENFDMVEYDEIF
jgi:hypothetical protein